MARRRMAISKFRTGIQHSATSVGNTGANTVESFSFCETAGGARSLGGATTTITAQRTTGDECNVGDVIKYVNLFLQAAGRTDTDLDKDRVGWMEYAVVMVKESEAPVLITNLGLETLGDVCTKMFRNECIWTGMFPVGKDQPNMISLQIKVPKFKQKLRLGDEWRFIFHFRSFDAGSTSSIAVRFIASTIYKAYQ